MKKAQPSSKQRLIKVLVGIVAGLVILSGVLYLARGWVRVTVLPAAVGIKDKPAVQKQYDAAMSEFNNPLKRLGFKVPEPTSPSCFRTLAHHFATAVTCVEEQSGYKLVPSDAAGKQQLRADAVALTNELKSAGWAKNTNTQLDALVNNLTSDIDYTPDAAYMKTFGKVTCLFDTNTAYSKPRAAAFNSRFSCATDTNVFGDPFQAYRH